MLDWVIVDCACHSGQPPLPCPLILDIDTELHLESVTISPYTLPGAGPGLPRTTKGREVMVKRERGNRKDSVRDPRGGHSG